MIRVLLNSLHHQLRLLLLALQFYTRIPVPRWVGFDPAWLSQSLRYFPLIGWLIGVLLTGTGFVALAFWPQAVAIVLTLAAGACLTGAMHEDGFADVCDGFGGGVNTERCLAIMADSRIGAYGALGLVLLMLLKFAALSHLPVPVLLAALLCAAPWSRLCALTLVCALPYAKSDGKAKSAVRSLHRFEFTVVASAVCVPTFIIFSFAGISMQSILLTVVLSGGGVGFMYFQCRKKLGGYTGDCLGATQQLVETMVYVGLLGHWQ